MQVFAASSLTDAFAEIERSFEQMNPTIDVQLNLAGSYSLREQILQGAPADVFATANAATMQAVVQGTNPAPTAIRFATNRLQLAVPQDNAAEVSRLADLARSELLVGLCLGDVPCGDLADRALAQVGSTRRSTPVNQTCGHC